MNSLQSQLLIASPDLGDPNFYHTVVLIIGHSEDGAMGLVLNRPSETMLKEAWEQVRDSVCSREESVHVGGPCPGPLMALHQTAALANAEVLEQVYLTQTPDFLEQLVLEDAGEARFFVGYAGWGPDQLEEELAAGAWSLLAADSETIFSSQLLDWQRLSRLASGASFYQTLGFRHVPPDPTVN